MKRTRAFAGTSIRILAALAGLFVAVSIAAADDVGQWIVVTPPAFRSVLAPLIKQREAQGFKVVILDTSEVFSPEQLQHGDGAPLLARLKALAQPGHGPEYVLLVGVCTATAPVENAVPSLRGAVARMKGQPSDSGYGLPDPDGAPTIAVGRFPARTVDELAGMVRKTIAFEQTAAPAPWRDRLLLLLGDPGGGPFAEMFVEQELRTDLTSLYPGWEMRTLFNVSSSPFYLPRPRDHETAMQYLQEGQLFSIYLGHSFAGGLGLDARFLFLRRSDWEKVNIPQGAGPFFTCGCFACQANENDPGYGLIAMRNSTGPVAVIGASGESFSAPGQLAVEGLLATLMRPPFPERLGQYWLAIQAGLARGKMDASTFALMDFADGSGGKMPLSVQRLEHLEMWLLLGDPALRLPVMLDDITLSTTGSATPGTNLKVTGALPDRLNSAAVHLTLERPLDSTAVGFEAVPPNSPENRQAQDRVYAANHRRANTYVLAQADAVVAGKTFSASLAVPDALTWTNLTLKAAATLSNETGLGVLVLPVNVTVRGTN
jgi:hypothetical protein